MSKSSFDNSILLFAFHFTHHQGEMINNYANKLPFVSITKDVTFVNLLLIMQLKRDLHTNKRIIYHKIKNGDDSNKILFPMAKNSVPLNVFKQLLSTKNQCSNSFNDEDRLCNKVTISWQNIWGHRPEEYPEQKKQNKNKQTEKPNFGFIKERLRKL